MARILIGNIKGPQGERGPQGVQGPVGPQGPQGPLPPLVNNALATEAGVSALDAAMGKTLQDEITENTQEITQLNSNIEAGKFVGNVNWERPLSLSISTSGTPRLVVMVDDEWVGDIAFTTLP